MFQCRVGIAERGGKAEKPVGFAVIIDEMSEVRDLDWQVYNLETYAHGLFFFLDLKEGYPLHCQKQSVNATKKPDWLLYAYQKGIMAFTLQSMLLTETVVTSQEYHKRIPNSLYSQMSNK